MARKVENPLKVDIYCFYDRSRGWYINPIAIKGEESAKACLRAALESKSCYTYGRYDDFDLYLLTSYDMATGAILRKSPRCILKGSSIKPNKG